MDGGDLAFMPLIEAARLFRARALSPVELTEAYLTRIQRLNERLGAYITVLGKQASAAARAGEAEIRRGLYRGLLHGIPYACKDLFATRGVRTTAGSRVLGDWVPDHDAAAVERLRRVGAVLLGKTNLHEFAYGATGENAHYGTARNPWDPSRLAGGSSSGSAAAVAGGLAAAALGTDTGGSVRVPAALCGLVGLKPTYGRVSCHGVIPYCWSLDHVGLLTRTVADAAAVLETLAGYDPRDAVSVDVAVPRYSEALDGGVRDLRIGIPRAFFFDHVDPEIGGAARRAVGIWERLGATTKEVDLPPMRHSRTVSLVIQLPEVLSYHSRYLRDRVHLYGPDLRSGLVAGQFLLAEHYVRAKRAVERYRREMRRVFEAIDVVVTPACPIVAPPLGTMTVTVDGREEVVGNALTRMTSFFNLTGHPALSMPSGLHSGGLPMAVQLVGRPFDEATVLRVAHTLETQLDWHRRPPAAP